MACRDLEAWVAGDLPALAEAFDEPKLATHSTKERFRQPDTLVRPVEAIRQILPEYQKIDGARRVGPFLNPEASHSKSFVNFCRGVQRSAAVSPWCCTRSIERLTLSDSHRSSSSMLGPELEPELSSLSSSTWTCMAATWMTTAVTPAGGASMRARSAVEPAAPQPTRPKPSTRLSSSWFFMRRASAPLAQGSKGGRSLVVCVEYTPVRIQRLAELVAKVVEPLVVLAPARRRVSKRFISTFQLLNLCLQPLGRASTQGGTALSQLTR